MRYDALPFVVQVRKEKDPNIYDVTNGRRQKVRCQGYSVIIHLVHSLQDVKDVVKETTFAGAFEIFELPT